MLNWVSTGMNWNLERCCCVSCRRMSRKCEDVIQKDNLASALGLQLHGEVKNLKAIPYKLLPNEVIKLWVVLYCCYISFADSCYYITSKNRHCISMSIFRLYQYIFLDVGAYLALFFIGINYDAFFLQMIPVAANDVAFSLHAVALTAFTVFQVFIYEVSLLSC